MLAERGVRVLVLDARPRLGGRATAFADRDTGEMVDNGQHVHVRLLPRDARVPGADRRRTRNVRIQAALEIPFIARRRTALAA